MNRFVCCTILLALSTAAFSQKVYFVYLQSEAAQSFIIKINDKAYSSAPSGFIIVSKLIDGSHNINVGFPQLKWPEQQFVVNISSKDQGFLLKNFGEKGWGLYDLQTMGIQMASEKSANEKALKTQFKEVSAFTEILSKAANDPSLKEKPVLTEINKAEIKKEEIKAKTQLVIVKEEKATLSEPQRPGSADKSGSLVKIEKSPAVIKEEVEKKKVALPQEKEIIVPKKEMAVPMQPYKKSVVVKKSESSTTEGFGLTFIDEKADGQKDTIQIIIPNPNSKLNITNSKLVEEKNFIDFTEQTKADSLSELKNVVNNNCSSIASESDFLKLRKKMAGQKSEESMISEAKKGFKTKCYSVEQIKNFGSLFLHEAAKFQFFEAAYPFSNDRNNFETLQNEFKDTYFIHRLKNLVK